MILQALLVSKDDTSAEILTHVLAQLGVAVARSSAADVAVTRLAEEHFDQVIVDFDDQDAAATVLEDCRRLTGPDCAPLVTVALLHDPSQIRSILGAGAHFIVNKPIVSEQAQNTLRAATALLKRERRQSLRVAVQSAVSIQLNGQSSNTTNGESADQSGHSADQSPENNVVEGILLDLSTGGMDVLAAKVLSTSAKVQVSFELPGGATLQSKAEVAWSTANGQTGLRFLDMELATKEELSQWLAAHSHDALPEEQDAASKCRLTDLSVGGCYVQTESPFPQCSAVDLCIRAAGLEIHADGLVRVMHPGTGMGIEFPARTEEQRASVGEFINFLSGQPGTTPQLEISPRSLIADAVDLNLDSNSSTEAEDPLLDLLRKADNLDEADFLAELHRQRTPAEVSQ